MKTVYILRGCPGSGKSFIANFIAEHCGDDPVSGLPAMVCSADNYFTADGFYKFIPEKLSEAHNYCKLQFEMAIDQERQVIIVDNTHTLFYEYEFYKTKAKEAGYYVCVLTVGEFTDEAVERYAVTNTHGVPVETIRKMRDRFKL